MPLVNYSLSWLGTLTICCSFSPSRDAAQKMLKRHLLSLNLKSKKWLLRSTAQQRQQHTWEAKRPTCSWKRPRSWPGESTALVAHTWCRRCLHHMSLRSEQVCSAGFTVSSRAFLPVQVTRWRWWHKWQPGTRGAAWGQTWASWQRGRGVDPWVATHRDIQTALWKTDRVEVQEVDVWRVTYLQGLLTQRLQAHYTCRREEEENLTNLVNSLVIN